jgi:glycosyltransferase involved in cell wall biosynthesis
MMHCGVPPVVRAIPTYDWLDDGEGCLKVERESEFVDAIRRLREDPDLRERVGTAAAARSEQFTLEAVGEELVGLYERLV